MQRILFACVDPARSSQIIEVLRQEAPQVHVSSGEAPTIQGPLTVVLLEPPADAAVAQLGRILRSSPPVPWLFLCSETPGSRAQQTLEMLLEERGTLVTPVDPNGLKGVLHGWMTSRKRTPTLNTQALSRLYLAGGRALADSVVSVFLSKAPALLKLARQGQAEGNLDACRGYLNELAQRAGAVGAHALEQRIHFIQEEIQAETKLDWSQMERAVEAACRVLEQQKKQDRTV